MTDRGASGVLETTKKYGDAWTTIVGAVGGTVTLATQLLPVIQQMSGVRWGLGIAGTIALIGALVYSHLRRRAAERERDEAMAGLAKVPTKEQLAAVWSLDRALQVDVMATDEGVELHDNRTDIKAQLRLMNRAPFPIRTLKLALKWSLTDSEGRPLLRGTKDVIEDFRALEPGGRERHVVRLTADALNLGAQPLPVAKLAVVGDIVAQSDVWDGNAKDNIGSFTWVVVVDRVIERVVDTFDGVLATERKMRR